MEIQITEEPKLIKLNSNVPPAVSFNNLAAETFQTLDFGKKRARRIQSNEDFFGSVMSNGMK